MTWEDLVADKRKRLDATIPQEWRLNEEPTEVSVMDYPKKSGIMNPEEITITETSATDLVAQMVKGELTSVAVTTAFCKRAALAQQLTNCFHEFFPDIALVRAKEVDEHLKTTGKPIGPLHGLPISLKDQLRVKGLETSMGYVSWLNKYETENSTIVDLLLKAGAVFYVKTSVPQSLMVCETVNNIIGRTVNPRNKNWSCGGSSGGEGAIVSLRGGAIGLGSDIGGSIRVPAAYNFLYGIKPSHGRLPYAKMANSMEGQDGINSVCGPLAHSVADMRLFVKSVLEQEPWKYDPRVVPIPWRESEADVIKAKLSSGGLTIGYYTSDDYILPHPPIIRGVETVISALKKAGHSTFHWPAYKQSHASAIANKLYTADRGADIIAHTTNQSGEPIVPNVAPIIMPTIPKPDTNELWALNLEKWNFQREYLEQFRIAEEKLGSEIDAIVAPVSATAAIRHNLFMYYGYTTTFNLLDFTSVVVPVTFADRDVDGRKEGYEPISEFDGVVQAEYDPEAYHGAPVAVQIVGRRLTEERIMAVAEEVGRLLGNEIVS